MEKVKKNEKLKKFRRMLSIHEKQKLSEMNYFSYLKMMMSGSVDGRKPTVSHDEKKEVERLELLFNDIRSLKEVYSLRDQLEEDEFKKINEMILSKKSVPFIPVEERVLSILNPSKRTTETY